MMGAHISRRRPAKGEPEGQWAASWRASTMGWSRNTLGQMLGISHQTIARYEAMDEVPLYYRLACRALMTGARDFDWKYPR